MSYLDIQDMAQIATFLILALALACADASHITIYKLQSETYDSHSVKDALLDSSGFHAELMQRLKKLIIVECIFLVICVAVQFLEGYRVIELGVFLNLVTELLLCMMIILYAVIIYIGYYKYKNQLPNRKFKRSLRFCRLFFLHTMINCAVAILFFALCLVVYQLVVIYVNPAGLFMFSSVRQKTGFELSLIYSFNTIFVCASSIFYQYFALKHYPRLLYLSTRIMHPVEGLLSKRKKADTPAQ